MATVISRINVHLYFGKSFLPILDRLSFFVNVAKLQGQDDIHDIHEDVYIFFVVFPALSMDLSGNPTKCLLNEWMNEWEYFSTPPSLCLPSPQSQILEIIGVWYVGQKWKFVYFTFILSEEKEQKEGEGEREGDMVDFPFSCVSSLF